MSKILIVTLALKGEVFYIIHEHTPAIITQHIAKQKQKVDQKGHTRNLRKRWTTSRRVKNFAFVKIMWDQSNGEV